jgi:hypothetical protein
MRNIVVSVGNNLMAEAITQTLADSGEFKPFRVLVGKKVDLANQCQIMNAETLLAEVSYASGTTFDKRISEVAAVRRVMPDCKIILLCDENSAPDIARAVMLAKKDGVIDAFFYSSVTTKYLVASLTAL